MLDLGQPVELIPKRGDILFFQHLFAHAGTANIRQTPRFAFRYYVPAKPVKNGNTRQV